MLLCYFKFLCQLDLTLIHYIIRQMAKDSVSLEYIADSERLTNCGAIYARIMICPIVVMSVEIGGGEG